MYPINQNLFSINFFCCSLSFSWLTEFVYFSMGKFFVCCALFGVQAVVFWFIITISESGRRGARIWRRATGGFGEQSVPRSYSEAFSAVTTEFPPARWAVAMKRGGKCVRWPWITPLQTNKKRSIIDSDENLLAPTSARGKFPFSLPPGFRGLVLMGRDILF